MEPIILECNAVVEDIYTDEKTGKKCIIVLNRFGYRLGYVEINSKVPTELFDDEGNYKYDYRHGESIVHFSNIMYNNRVTLGNRYTLPVHGGITFVGNKEYLQDKYMRAVGFDCGHYCDAPDIESVEKYLGKDSMLAKILKDIEKDQRFESHVWTIGDVREELGKLACKLKIVEDKYLIKIRNKRRKQWVNKK
ncbi:MAG: hypothetical protein J6A59_13890 [Lachnospiraceae bacterium]|nr:hypothetical protein [Lachnospiraceae bacterium]